MQQNKDFYRSYIYAEFSNTILYLFNTLLNTFNNTSQSNQPKDELMMEKSEDASQPGVILFLHYPVVYEAITMITVFYGHLNLEH